MLKNALVEWDFDDRFKERVFVDLSDKLIDDLLAILKGIQVSYCSVDEVDFTPITDLRATGQGKFALNKNDQILYSIAIKGYPIDSTLFEKPKNAETNNTTQNRLENLVSLIQIVYLDRIDEPTRDPYMHIPGIRAEVSDSEGKTKMIRSEEPGVKSCLRQVNVTGSDGDSLALTVTTSTDITGVVDLWGVKITILSNDFKNRQNIKVFATLLLEPVTKVIGSKQ